jgi:hypothetical protein
MDPVMNGAHGRHYVRLAGAQHEAIVRLREENAQLRAELERLEADVDEWRGRP